MCVWQDVMQHKLVFIETQDVVETTLALDNYRRACDCGRGAVFFSVARQVYTHLTNYRGLFTLKQISIKFFRYQFIGRLKSHFWILFYF